MDTYLVIFEGTVLAKPNPKAHAEKGKGRGRVERGKKKGREIRLSEGWLS